MSRRSGRLWSISVKLIYQDDLEVGGPGNEHQKTFRGGDLLVPTISKTMKEAVLSRDD
jgi:hypothetical protein